VQSTNRHSRRGHQGRSLAAAYSAAPVFEMLEGRQLMSVTVPSMGPTAMMAAGSMGPSMHAPLVANGATAMAVSAATSIGGTGTGGTPTGGSGGTVMARSLWDRLKGAAKWVKNHVVIGLHNIGYKGTF
jgi:hypothetical protein